MAITVYTSSNLSVQLEDKPLATAGGEGSVHRVVSGGNYSNCCAKIYHRHKRTPLKMKKVEFMIKHKPINFSTPRFVICWPMEVILGSNKDFIGFIMPLAFSKSEKLYELTTTKISKRLSQTWNKFERSTQTGIEKRFIVCLNIAIAIHTIHQTCKYVIVDIKPQNILITIDGKISITDVDSFQISENNILLHYAEVRTPEYSPPEAEKLIISKSFIPESWDRFSLAVCFYEILFGIHPYTATSTGQYSNIETIEGAIQKGLFVHGSKKGYLSYAEIHDNFTNLPISIKNLFIKAFDDGHTNPKIRPSAEQWGENFFNELNIKTGIKPNNIIVQPRSKISQATSYNPPYVYKPPSPAYIPPSPAYIPTRTISISKIVWRVFLVLIIISVFLGGAKLISNLVNGGDSKTLPKYYESTKPTGIEDNQPAIIVANWVYNLSGNLQDAYKRMTKSLQKENSNFFIGYGSITKTYVHISKLLSIYADNAEVEIIYDAQDSVNDRKPKNGGRIDCFGRYHSIFILKKINGDWMIDKIKNKTSGFSDYREFLPLASYGIR